jgi:hypothetical protein
MRSPRTVLPRLFLAGLVVIALGFTLSLGLGPRETLVPLGAVVFGLSALTAMAGSGPRAFL